MTKIYTKTGDKGSTSLATGERVPKSSLRVEAYGTVDELNSFIGFAVTQNNDKEVRELLTKIQRRLFELASDIATPLPKEAFVPRIEEKNVTHLEEQIDYFQEMIPPLKNFIIPGGEIGASSIHVARTVCRRAERALVRLIEEEEEKVNINALKYLNRLADLLFVLARVSCHRAECPENIWSREHLLERE